MLMVGLFAAGFSSSPGAEPGRVDFFEAKIRPVLVKECYSCHSSESKKLRGGLRLDSRAGMLKGGDSGPAIVAGNPEESLLLQALRYDELEMPPKGRLAPTVIADFTRWVKEGAIDPRVESKNSAAKTIDIEAGRRFWAYQKPSHHDAPEAADKAWPRTEIDRFILAALEARGLKPVRDATRRELLRRVSFDLVGLPPSVEDIEAFEHDSAPDAFERQVDRLLNSPHFGERWGRHWLDVVRFAESLTLRGFILKQTWRYRDYVIEAFNADMPFDRFVREQIAGDLLPAENVADRRSKLVATQFLFLGDTNLEEQDKRQLRMDVVDEQLDTIGKAFLAQTIGCARCHDHKFDPIPTRDYYALAGILGNVKTLEHGNVSMLIERPLPEEPEKEALLARHEESIAALEARIAAAKKSANVGATESALETRGVLTPREVPGVVVDDSQATRVGEWKASKYSGSYIGDGYLHDENASKGEKSLTFHPELPEAGKYEVWLAYSAGSNRAASVPITILSADGETTTHVDQTVAAPIRGRFTSLGQFRFERNGQGYVLISNEGTAGHVIADAVLFIPVADLPRALADRPDASSNKKESVAALESELKKLRASGPKRETIPIGKEEAEIRDCPVHIRGSVQNLGEVVPRGFLRVATFGSPSPLPSRESGRRELADWLANADNPLTARVIVNRVWSWLFGTGLVRTVDNFGTTGDSPSHPELLDELTLKFIDEGWSLKSLIRRIVLSRAYQISCDDDSPSRERDPESRLIWRRLPRRLDAESLRDAMLGISGQLKFDMKGPGYPPQLAADYGFPQVDVRRSVYVPVFRNALPELFSAFDFADPGMVVGRRDVSTVAPQALFLLNHPFVIEQARLAARRLRAHQGLSDGQRLDRAFQLALGRLPTEAESRIAREYLASRPDEGGASSQERRWSVLFQTLFATIDFRYIK